ERRMRRGWLGRGRRDEVSDLARKAEILTENRLAHGGRGGGRYHLGGIHKTGDNTERKRAKRLGAAARIIDEIRAKQIRGYLGEHRAVGIMFRVRRERNGLQSGRVDASGGGDGQQLTAEREMHPVVRPAVPNLVDLIKQWACHRLTSPVGAEP